MRWYWIVLMVVGALLAFFLIAGYLLFRYICGTDRKKSASLEGDATRTLKDYAPLIKQKAVQNASLPHEIVNIKAFDGFTLRAKFYANRLTDRVVILLHGYHSCVSWDFGASFEMYYQAGYSILAVDHRGHGSGGDYVGFGALDRRDVQRWMDWIVSRCGDSSKIALAGVSMGAATALLVSGNDPIPQLAAVIEDSGFSSMQDLLQKLIRNMHVPPMPLLAFASLWSKILAGYWFGESCPEHAVLLSQTPTLFIHGTADAFVPFEMMGRVYAACAAPKEKAVFEGAIHGESSYRDPERYRAVVCGFLGKYMV
ncbi:MAG: alpha/beta hydrolase [Clostridia bacterium]|nr:alpha/beta hydrolase [Clostridia bacterium]